jgi:hypothetical protein
MPCDSKRAMSSIPFLTAACTDGRVGEASWLLTAEPWSAGGAGI